jgi:hypothetical protein
MNAREIIDIIRAELPDGIHNIKDLPLYSDKLFDLALGETVAVRRPQKVLEFDVPLQPYTSYDMVKISDEEVSVSGFTYFLGL